LDLALLGIIYHTVKVTHVKKYPATAANNWELPFCDLMADGVLADPQVLGSGAHI
jgi:hypothetical protein